MANVHVIGSGVAGLSCAYTLLQRGVEVHVTTASAGPDASCCSWWAGGMLAPHCEQEAAEPLIGKLGVEGMLFWETLAQTTRLEYQNKGTLVVTQTRDQSDLQHFERLTSHSKRLDSNGINELEPALNHFNHGLFFAGEAHLEPRTAIKVLWQQIVELGATLELEQKINDDDLLANARRFDWQIDCRGLEAASVLTDLRGVKGEMLHLYSPEIQLTRPIRLLHPRYPLYIVPRPDHQFMIGATMIESNTSRRASVRSTLELLSAAYAVHPAFAEAQIIEIGVDSRPAFDDNLPRIRRYGNIVYVNGLFRHGFLIGPALARRAADLILTNTICDEVVDANFPERPNHRHAANHT